MFCANCGTKIDDGKFKCEKCGWESPIKPSMPATPAATPAAPATPVTPVSAPAAPAAPVAPASAPVAPATPVKPVSAPVAPATPVTPVSAPVAPATPVKPASAPVAPAASVQKPITHITPQVNPVNSANVPASNVVVQNGVPAAKPKKKKTGLITAIVLIVFFVVAVISVGAGYLIYSSTDSYKLSEATELIETGIYADLDEAEGLISEIYTSEAEALREFITVEREAMEFSLAATDFCGTGALSVSNPDPYSITDEYESFVTAVTDLSNSQLYYSLPVTLQARLIEYDSAISYITEYIFGDEEGSKVGLYDHFIDVQSVMLNEVKRNDSTLYGYNFTLNELQTRVNTSKNALVALEDYDFKNVKLIKGSGSSINVSLSEHAVSVISNLIAECENETVSSQEIIDGGLEEFGAYEYLYMTNADPFYSSYVGEYLEEISSESDITENADELAAMLQVELLYWFLDDYKE